MISINIIGTGNVATQLTKAFLNLPTVTVQQVYSRKPSTNLPLHLQVHHYTQLLPATVTLIVVSDNAITEVSESIPYNQTIVSHTSGSTPLQALNAKHRRSVWYPLQTFSINEPVDFTQTPICIETENPTDYTILSQLAQDLQAPVYSINSAQREKIHLAAVFVNNFTNALYQIGAEICAENNIPFEILKPLINRTAAQINHLSPSQAQTGPARRNDTLTLNKQLQQLTQPQYQQLYQLFTEIIKKTYHE